jgi:hypothetical protein
VLYDNFAAGFAKDISAESSDGATTEIPFVKEPRVCSTRVIK